MGHAELPGKMARGIDPILACGVNAIDLSQSEQVAVSDASISAEQDMAC
jgi:hypothetical protein